MTTTTTAGATPRRSKRLRSPGLAVPDAAPSSSATTPSGASPDPVVSRGVPVTPDVAGSVAADALVEAATTKKKRRVRKDDAVRPDLAPSSSSSMVGSVVVGVLSGKATEKAPRPTPLECAYVVQELGKLHPGVLKETKDLRQQLNSCGRQKNILDGVVNTMLSQNTTAANSTRAFANLKKAFPSWDKVLELETPAKLEEAIHCGGLAKIKAGRIMNICRILKEERGAPSLEYLRNFSNEKIQKELMRFPGLGKKTVSCVLLFTLGREEFPVDTHVHRIAKQLKWTPASYSRDDAYDYLNEVVPPPLKHDLHCLLIQHGRECHRCAARGKPQFPPKDGSKLECPLVNLHAKKQFVLESPLVLVKKEC